MYDKVRQATEIMVTTWDKNYKFLKNEAGFEFWEVYDMFDNEYLTLVSSNDLPSYLHLLKCMTKNKIEIEFYIPVK